MDIKIISFNIRYDNPADGENRWDNRKEAVVQFLRATQADFIGLQEVVPTQIHFIENMLNEYGVVFRTRDQNTSYGEASPLLFLRSRWEIATCGTFWLSEQPQVEGSVAWGSAFPRIATYGRFRSADGKTVLVLNTHFDHQSQTARKNSALLLLEKIQAMRLPGEPVFLTGDLNATPTSRTVKLLDKSVFLFRLKPAKRGVLPFNATFHNWGRQNFLQIDYIFASENVKVHSFEIHNGKAGNRYLSDHYPLIAVAEI